VIGCVNRNQGRRLSGREGRQPKRKSAQSA
jgi:hypothetical protein